MANSKKKMDKKTLTRIICLATAVVMVLSTLIAAVLSQVY